MIEWAVPPLPGATKDEKLAYNALVESCAYRHQGELMNLEQGARWLKRAEEEPGWLPAWQEKAIRDGRPYHQKLADELTAQLQALTQEHHIDTISVMDTLGYAAEAAILTRPRIRTMRLELGPALWQAILKVSTPGTGKTPRTIQYKDTIIQVLGPFPSVDLDEMTLWDRNLSPLGTCYHPNGFSGLTGDQVATYTAWRAGGISIEEATLLLEDTSVLEEAQEHGRQVKLAGVKHNAQTRLPSQL